MSVVTAAQQPCRGRAGEKATVSLVLLGEFSLSSGSRRLVVPHSAQRVVAFLALQRGWTRRTHVAGSLWGDVSERRAHASLRSALWRLHQLPVTVLEHASEDVRLGAQVEVDLHQARGVMRAVLGGAAPTDAVDVLSGDLDDLLPGWYEEWVLAERERLREHALLALETLAERSIDTGNLTTAVLAALAVVEREPLRERALRALVHAQLLTGNVAEAMRRYRAYERLLRQSLRLDPSPHMRALLAPVLNDSD